jgi:hypothetical protein
VVGGTSFLTALTSLNAKEVPTAAFDRPPDMAGADIDEERILIHTA